MAETVIKFQMEKDCADLIPRKAHPDDAAYDLRSRVDIVAEPMAVTLVPTGLHLELPVNFEAQIRPRSGMALKHALTLLNTPGTIDAGYRGEICCIVFNAGKQAYPIKRGDRIAQMVICRLPEVCLQETSVLTETERGSDGFGSTGKS